MCLLIFLFLSSFGFSNTHRTPLTESKDGTLLAPQANKRKAASRTFPPKKLLAVRLNSESARMARQDDSPWKTDVCRPTRPAGVSAHHTPPIVRKPRSDIPRRPRVFGAPAKPTRKVNPQPSPSDNHFLYILAQAGESLEREGKDEERKPPCVPSHSQRRVPPATLRIKSEGKSGLKAASSNRPSSLMSPSSVKRSLSTKAQEIKTLSKPATLSSLKNFAGDSKAPPKKSQGNKSGVVVPAAKREGRPGDQEHDVLTKNPPHTETPCSPSPEAHQPTFVSEDPRSIEFCSLARKDDTPRPQSPHGSPSPRYFKVGNSSCHATQCLECG